MSDLSLKTGDFAPALTVVGTYSDGTVIDLTGAGVTFSMWQAGNRGTPKIDDAAATIVGLGTAGTMAYSWSGTDTNTAGPFLAEFHVTLADGKKVTVPNNGYLEVLIEPRVD